MIVVAGVVIFEGNIMIARRASHKSNSGLWEFPGGKPESGESDQVALAREFMEEFGMSIEAIDRLGIFPFESPTLTIDLHVWYCSPLSMPTHATDHDMIEWVSTNNLSRYTFSPADIPAVELILKRGLP